METRGEDEGQMKRRKEKEVQLMYESTLGTIVCDPFQVLIQTKILQRCELPW